MDSRTPLAGHSVAQGATAEAGISSAARSREIARVRAEHTPEAIAERLGSPTRHNHLGDGVLGALDGTVTTFAIVAGALGSGLPANVAVVLGLANVVADGFSMAAGNFMRAKAERELVQKARRLEEQHIALCPEGEREEIRQLFERKGLAGPALDEVVAAITRDERRWVDTMLAEELRLRLDLPTPLRAAAITFVCFLAAGLIPLVPLQLLAGRGPFLASALATAATFAVIGAIQGKLTDTSPWKSALGTLLLGGCAALLAYAVGAAARHLSG
jgi:VIT1/CCC1 family predicted Fe2+/Mn2+ transporter